MKVETIKINWNYGKKLIIPPLPKKGKVLCIIQARTTSTRFPNKIYEELNGCPVLYHVIARAKQCTLVDEVIVASPNRLDDLPVGIRNFVFKGIGEWDVLSRYVECAQENEADYYLRLTSDCPLLAPSLIDTIIYYAKLKKAEYCSNVFRPTFPDGVDAEVINQATMNFLAVVNLTKYDREHVTTAIRSGRIPNIWPGKVVSIENKVDLSQEKYSIDNPEDLERLKKLEDLGSYI